MNTPRQFVSQLDKQRIVDAIRDAETKSSAEIRVFISRRPVTDAVAEAQRHFVELNMDRTRHRNGVLIFVAPASRVFAVIGDTGIHQHCGDAFWSELALAMTDHFRESRFTAGIIEAIGRTGVLLARHFPPSPDDTDELPNEIACD